MQLLGLLLRYLKHAIFCFLFQDKVGKPKTTREPNYEAKGTVVSGGAIQIIQKGDKEVLTLRKPPDKATLNTYTPDTKAKEDELRNAKNEVSNKDLAKSDVKNRTDKDVLKDQKNSKLIPVVCTARSVLWAPRKVAEIYRYTRSAYC